MNLAPGDIFEQRFEVREELAGDDYGVVYRATALDSGREVAIRILLAPTDGYPAGFAERFLADAQLASRLRNAGTLQTEAFGQTSTGALYLVTELVNGPTLADLLSDEEIPQRDALGVVKRMAESLAEAHEVGLLHRDLRPSSIIVPLRRGVLGAKLGEWGTTKALENDSPLAPGGPGNPRYMSPEQVLGEPMTAASNIYSLGLVMYELVTREPCITGASSREILAAHLSTTEFELPASVPPALGPVLRRMIAKSLADRFQSAQELRNALAKVDESQLGLTVQMKVARMVEAIQSADDSRGAEDTIVDPRFLEPDSGESTRERLNEPTDVEASFEQLLNFIPSDDEVTNIVAETTLADESSVPGELTEDDVENEPTDEVTGKRPQRAQRKPSAKRPARRTPPPPAAPAEERVSGWTAVGAIVGAVIVALGMTAAFLYLRSNTMNTPARAVRSHAASQAGASPVLGSPTALVIPAIDVDLGAPIAAVDDIKTGCGIARNAGWAEQSQVVGLTEFSYQAYIPSAYSGQPFPVILVAHAPNGHGKFWTEDVGLTKLADEFGAILVAPFDRSLRPWVKDLAGSRAEFERVLKHASETFCVDQRRVFAVGMSTGAFALQRYSCSDPDRFRALALVANWATAKNSCPSPRRAATLVINGLADRVSPPQGGPGCWGGDVRLSLDDYVDDLAALHSCREPQEWSKEPGGTCTGYSHCAADLVACKVPEAAHIWPGAIQSEVRCIDELEGGGNGGSDFPTASVIRRFFEQQVAEDAR